MTRANTPDSLSTRTEIVAMRMVLSGMLGTLAAQRKRRGWPAFADNDGSGTQASDQHKSLVSDAGGFVFVFGTEDHLVMRRAGRNHREAVLLRIHRDVGNHRAIGRQHLEDHVVHL